MTVWADEHRRLAYRADPTTEAVYATLTTVPDHDPALACDLGSSDHPWPVLAPEALHGLPGEVVRTIDPHTEADTAAVLVSFLTAFGSAVGPGPHALADGAQHPGRLFAVIVGRTSKARKGTSWRHVLNVMRLADPDWAGGRVLGGLSSGEGLIAAVGDGTEDKDGNVVGSVDDKRVLAVEEEYSRVLAAKGRDGNTLSALIRQAWDNGQLRSMTKTPLVATGAHVSLIGHVTVEELQRCLTETDRANGFANRFLFVAAKRSKLLPRGGNLDDAEIETLGRKVRARLHEARRVGRLTRSAAAEQRWETVYHDLAADDTGGLSGAVLDRAEAQLLRLSVVYALADGSTVIDLPHLLAAEAVWRYCAASVRHIFGDAVGDPVADRLLQAIKAAGADGLDGTAQRDVFGRHQPGPRLEVARRSLETRGMIATRPVTTEGRTRHVSYLARFCDRSDRSDQSPPSVASVASVAPHEAQIRDLRSLRSLRSHHSDDDQPPAPTDEDLARWTGDEDDAS